jgi:protein NUD1
MEHAWLDSLSEDWVSQPGSDGASLPPASSLPRSFTRSKTAPQLQTTSNRISLRNGGASKPGSAYVDGSSNILSERSVNDINIQRSQRLPSKLSHEIRFVDDRRNANRSVSASTAGSVIHNTVNRSQSLSPKKFKGDTPEWKRRLLGGELAYGEQRDLFSSAAVGLENMFRPPPPSQQPIEEETHNTSEDVTQPSSLPSSPPNYPERAHPTDLQDSRSLVSEISFEPPRPKTRVMKYRSAEESTDMSASGSVRIHRDESRGSESVLSGHASAESVPVDYDSRKVSNGSVLRNEDFSPIIVSHEKPGYGIDVFGGLEVQPNELQKRLEKLRRNQMMLATAEDDVMESKSIANDQRSLHIDDTQDFEKAGGFINFRRGGRSAEGSFRHRRLSTSIHNTDTSEMLPEESLQASTPKQYPTIRVEKFTQVKQTPNMPPAPHPSPERGTIKRNPKTGSPLKLFGPYDTFTNQTLMRRISQYEDSMSDNSRNSGPQLASGEPSQPNEEGQKPLRQDSAMFGAGDLDGFEFDEQFSRLSLEGDAPHESRADNRPRARYPLHLDISHMSAASDEDELIVSRRRRKSSGTGIGSMASTKRAAMSVEASYFDHSPEPESQPPLPATPTRRDSKTETKRPRTSPSKDPTPKRRRTLHLSDVAYGVDDSAGVTDLAQTSYANMQSLIGRKRRDARDGDLQQLANPDVLAMRQILRPRTPTPSQRSSVQRERHPSGTFPPSESTSHSRSPERQSQSRGSPSKPGDPFVEPDRKPSIKTEDFMNEANRIMAMLRSKARQSGGLASLEESESEGGLMQPPETDVSFQESTKEPFSRPPSREGRPVPRASTRQEDPDVLARLKKYEERSDMDDVIASSTRSLGLAQEAIRAAQEVGQEIRRTVSGSSIPVGFDSDESFSDPPNLRISQSTVSKNHSSEKADSAAAVDGIPSHTSTSSGNSTGRSIPTGSSRGSDSRKTIAPQTVSHLIPEQVGNMVWDAEHQIWMRRKSIPSLRGMHHILPSEGSEDDPFAGIPDLTVDATMERENLRLRNAVAEAQAELLARSEATIPSPSNSHPASSARKPILISPTKKGSIRQPLRASPLRESTQTEHADDDDVEHEISIREGRDTQNTPSKRRNLTISFSSPIASIIQDIVMEDTVEINRGRTEVDAVATTDAVRHGARKVSIKKGSGRKGRARSRSNSRGASVRVSVAGQAFVPRPVSRIEEHDEEAGTPKGLVRHQEQNLIKEHASTRHRKTSVSVVVTTPAPARQDLLPEEQEQLMAQYVGMMSLSPMSDFTIHRDRSMALEASYVLEDRHLKTGDDAKLVMSQSLRDLVDRITEVEPFEPYWEDMEEIDLHEKRLASLHKLDDFCGKLVTVNASQNTLRNLSGIPATVRHLKVVDNQLSELTSWGHLMNLQYLDVSNNEIKTLSGLRHLVHLRSLKADNCGLTDLDALMDHDGIQTLRARGNLIREVDFEGNGLARLVDLDLEGNQLASIRNVDQLPSLTSLRLRGNHLKQLCLSPQKDIPLLSTRELGDNQLTSFDVSHMPRLKVLHADRNELVKITGFQKTPRLDSLSLREQGGAEHFDVTCIYYAYEVRKLYLSGNRIDAFNPPRDFLNLQLLELANCGLTVLAAHLGRAVPNLRKLNLSFNAIPDLGPLAGIQRLKRLWVAGNRLTHSEDMLDLLLMFPFLTEADLRGNSITQGFYPPPMADAKADPFYLGDADAARDTAYERRLDLATAMRRRVYRVMYGDELRRLRKLDGLALDRALGKVRDAVWDAMGEHGLQWGDGDERTGGADVQDEEREQVDEEELLPEQRDEREVEAEGELYPEELPHSTIELSRWLAEDSFA